MSYLRWLTPLPITETCQTCNRIPSDEDPGRVICHDCTSHWYVFFHADGYLAVWAAGDWEENKISREELKNLIETGNLSCLHGFEEHGDQGVLKEALTRALADWPEEEIPQ